MGVAVRRECQIGADTVFATVRGSDKFCSYSVSVEQLYL